MELKYNIRNNNVLVVYPTGKMDINLSMSFEDNLRKIMKENQNCHMLIDLKDVEYINSSILRIFVTTKKMLNTKGFDLKVFNAQDQCKRIFDVTHFENLINVFNNEKEAIASFSS